MIKTETLKINRRNPEHDKIRYAAEIIKRGGLVVFPTETVYGLGAGAFDAKAVRNIFKAKGRPADNPLIVHIAEAEDVGLIAKRPPLSARILMQAFWPGPLTLILKKKKIVPDVITAGGDTVAVRMPDNKIARSLIKEAGAPLVAPSANLSGRPSPTRARDVVEDLAGRVDLIIDGGATDVGIESTVVDMTEARPVILRPGGVSREDIERVIGKVRVLAFDGGHEGASQGFVAQKALLKSPGLKYKHYAPRAEVIIVEGRARDVHRKIRALADEALKYNKKVGIISFRKNARYKGCIVAFAGSDLLTAARRLFTILRELDKKEVDIIISESPADRGIGLAVSDRLKRAAGYNIINV